jgi:hypothetical protein
MEEVSKHYGKNGRCRATTFCRETKIKTHGNEERTAMRTYGTRQRGSARQSLRKAHGNENPHGKENKALP